MSEDESNILPEYVYKYMSFDVAKSVLSAGTLGFSKSVDFGKGLGPLSDKNEFLWEYKEPTIRDARKKLFILSGQAKEKEEQKYYKYLCENNPVILQAQNINRRILNDEKKLRKWFENERDILKNDWSPQLLRDRMDNKCRVCCLSYCYDNTYLWDNVAPDSHVVCFKLLTGSIVENYKNHTLKYVDYKEKPSFNPFLPLFDGVLERMIFTKTDEYKLEKELRLLLRLSLIQNDSNFEELVLGDGRVIINDKRLKEYLVGVYVKNLPLESKKELDELIASGNYDVKESSFV